jgi:hypothetical protein
LDGQRHRVHASHGKGVVEKWSAHDLAAGGREVRGRIVNLAFVNRIPKRVRAECLSNQGGGEIPRTVGGGGNRIRDVIGDGIFAELFEIVKEEAPVAAVVDLRNPNRTAEFARIGA